jgi:hypothetical protein
LGWRAICTFCQGVESGVDFPLHRLDLALDGVDFPREVHVGLDGLLPEFIQLLAQLAQRLFEFQHVNG